MRNFLAIRNHMSLPPIVTTPETTAADAMALMRRHGVRHLPVERDGKLVGILSDFDLFSRDSIDRVLCSKVGDLMTQKPYHVYPECPVTEVIVQMSEMGVGAVPVVDGYQRVIGIFTEKDAVRVFVDVIEQQEEETRPMPAVMQ